MIKYLFFTVCLCLLVSLSEGQSLIFQEGFEGADYDGYTTSIPFQVFSIGSDDDYFLRGQTPPNNTSCTPTCWPAISNFEGNNYLLWEDFDGPAGGNGTVTISLDPISIAGYENMSVSIGMAAPNPILTRYEAADFIAVEYQVDGSSWARVHYASGGPEGGSSTAGRFRYDDNKDGAHNSAETLIAETMVYFTANLDALAGSAVTGSSMNIRVISLSGSQEEMAIDDIRLMGTLNTPPPTILSSPSPTTTCQGAVVNLSVTASNATSYAWEVSSNNVSFLPLNNGGIYSGTNSSVLSITANTTLDGKYYRCVVTGAAAPAATSASALLTVDNAMPRLTSVDPLNNLITITNCSSNCSVNLTNYKFCSRFGYTPITSGMAVAGSLNLAPNASVTLNWSINEGGGDLGLYIPGGSFANPAAMVDFMQWNTSGNGRENVANAKGIWTSGEFLAGAAPYTRTDCNLSGQSNWTAQSVADNTDDVCNSFSKNSISGTGWYTIVDGGGNTVVSINPNGNDLGDVSASMQEYSVDTLGDMAGNAYLNRYLNLESTIFDGISDPFPSPVGIRLFYPNSTLNVYNTATSNTYTIDQLNIIHYAGINENCDLSNNGNVGEIILPPVAKNLNTPGFYLEFDVGHFSEFGAGEEPTLAQELTSFTGSVFRTNHELKWVTSTENGFSHFELERSVDGLEYRRLGSLAGQGNNSHYDYTDETPFPGENYYRLKLVDENGSYSYSKVLVLKSEKVSITTIYPNPVKNWLNLQFEKATTDKMHVSIYSVTGIKISEQAVPPNEFEFRIESKDLSPGAYFIRIQYEEAFNTFPFVKIN